MTAPDPWEPGDDRLDPAGDPDRNVDEAERAAAWQATLVIDEILWIVEAHRDVLTREELRTFERVRRDLHAAAEYCSAAYQMWKAVRQVRALPETEEAGG